MTDSALATSIDLNQLLDTQRLLEEEAIGTGVHRFKKQLEAARKGGRGAQTGSTKYLLSTCMGRMLLVLEADQKAKENITGPKPLMFKWSKLVGLEEFAYLTSKCILNALFTVNEEVPNLANAISQLVIDELRYRRFRATDTKGFRQAVSRLNTSSYTHMSRSLLAIMGKNEHMAAVDMSDLALTPRDRMLLGVQAIETFMQANPNVIYREGVIDTPRGLTVRKTRVFIRAGAETMEWINKRDTRLADMFPAQMPMVVPPLSWAPGCDGGFRYALKGKWRMVRGRGSAISVEEGKDMPVVYEALNAIQNTAWKINLSVLAVAEELVRKGGDCAGLPSFEPIPAPARPADLNTNATSLRDWKKVARAVHDANYTRKQACTAPSRIISIARRFSEFEALWFPHDLDFRGRVYPQCEHLSPQGSDLGKACLVFAEATPMGEKGGDFLALHLANCVDKLDGVKANTLTRAERIAWTKANTKKIEAAAANPIGERWWMDADAPFLTLAACFAWARYAHSGFSKHHLCDLPVAQDGSCNGLQHFSAMFRDEVGAVTVNVANNSRPRDIYHTVSEHVLRSLEDKAIDDAYARLWLNSGLIDRSFAKTPTMTFGYGSKRFGFSEAVSDYVVTHPLWKTGDLRTLFRDELGDKSVLGKAATMMANELWSALGRTVTKAQEAMDWMQEAASGISKTGKPVSWVVPLTGFKVTQNYWKPNMKQVKTILSGEAYYPATFTDTDKVHAHKQRNSIAPNIVHSLDAAALMLTVSEASALGVRSFGMVHDSYATTPGEAEALYRCTRSAFFRLYEAGNVAEALAEQLKAQWEPKKQAKFPALPNMGTFDLRQVLDSEYFFC